MYLLSKDGGGSAGPLVAALTDAVLRAAVQAAERAGGRLDPPLLAVLDEAANVCRIADLPLLYSHFGSRGVIPVTILQSYAQGSQAWGAAGMKTLWAAANVKLVGAGADDASFLADISRVVGDHDVPTVSRGSGRGGYTRTHTTRRQAILSAADLRSLRRGDALLLAAGCKPALLRLQPWYRSTDRDAIAAAIDHATQHIAKRSAA